MLNKILWKLHRLFGRGCLVIIKPTMKCNLDCWYCSNVIATGKRIEYDEVTPKDWVDYLKRFPVKIQVVAISGGEPQVYPHINELINKLIYNGYWVRMTSNMTKRNITIKPNKRFAISTSYHRQVSKDKFDSNLEYYKKYNILFKKELGPLVRKIDGSTKMPIVNENIDMVKNSKLRHKWFRSPLIKFVVTPDLTLFTSCLESNVGRVLK